MPAKSTKYAEKVRSSNIHDCSQLITSVVEAHSVARQYSRRQIVKGAKAQIEAQLEQQRVRLLLKDHDLFLIL